MLLKENNQFRVVTGCITPHIIDYFPITACPIMFYSFYSLGIMCKWNILQRCQVPIFPLFLIRRLVKAVAGQWVFGLLQIWDHLLGAHTSLQKTWGGDLDLKPCLCVLWRRYRLNWPLCTAHLLYLVTSHSCLFFMLNG